MVEDATICVSVSSSSKNPVIGERAKVLSSREEGVENHTKLSKRNQTLKKTIHKSTKAKGNENQRESEK